MKRNHPTLVLAGRVWALVVVRHTTRGLRFMVLAQVPLRVVTKSAGWKLRKRNGHGQFI